MKRPADESRVLPQRSVGTRGFSLDHVYRALLVGAAGLVFVVVALIVYEVVRGALPSIRAIGWGFLVRTEWDPVQDHFGALPYLYGTLVSSFLALLMAGPLGIRSAVYLAELASPPLSAIILALGRALGETMAVTMVIGNTNRISLSLLDPGATMSSIIANEFTEATTDIYLSALIQIALVLFVLTLVVNALARGLVLVTTGGRRDVAGAA